MVNGQCLTTIVTTSRQSSGQDMGFGGLWEYRLSVLLQLHLHSSLPYICQNKLVLILVWVFTTNNDDDNENFNGHASTIFSISTIISWGVKTRNFYSLNSNYHTCMTFTYIYSFQLQTREIELIRNRLPVCKAP